MHEPILSPRHMVLERWPTHVRGPNYTRATFAEYGPEVSFQPYPIWMVNGQGLQGLGGDADQQEFLQSCARVPSFSEEDCAESSRQIGNGNITVEQAYCELECEKHSNLAKWGQCVGKCYQPWYEKLGTNPYVLGALALGIGYLVSKQLTAPSRRRYL